MAQDLLGFGSSPRQILILIIFILQYNVRHQTPEKFNSNSGKVDQRIFIEVISHFDFYIVSGESDLLGGDFRIEEFFKFQILPEY